jgi:hypothetical protein
MIVDLELELFNYLFNISIVCPRWTINMQWVLGSFMLPSSPASFMLPYLLHHECTVNPSRQNALKHTINHEIWAAKTSDWCSCEDLPQTWYAKRARLQLIPTLTCVKPAFHNSELALNATPRRSAGTFSNRDTMIWLTLSAIVCVCWRQLRNRTVRVGHTR